MKTVAIIAARMGSTRFPGKVLKPMTCPSSSVLGWVYHAARVARGVDAVIVATTTETRDDEIEQYCNEYFGLGHVFRGSEWDVISRFRSAAEVTNADLIVRLTGDCPFLDSRVIDEVIELKKITGVSYASNVDPPTYPDGLDVQVVTRAALVAADDEATRHSDRDTVIEYISRQRHRWPRANLVCPLPGLEKERWVLDTEEDYQFCREVVRYLEGYSPTILSILAVLRKHPELRKINEKWKRNERFYEAVAKE